MAGSLNVVIGIFEIEDGIGPPGPKVPIKLRYDSQAKGCESEDKLIIFAQKVETGNISILVKICVNNSIDEFNILYISLGQL